MSTLSVAFYRLLVPFPWNRDFGAERRSSRCFLAGRALSIADDWQERGESNPEIRTAEVAAPGDGDEGAPSPLPDPPSRERSTEDHMVGEGEAQELAKLFADDPAALQILECIYLELTRREMGQRTQMSEKKVAATVRRVKRWGKKLRAGRS